MSSLGIPYIIFRNTDNDEAVDIGDDDDDDDDDDEDDDDDDI